MEGGSGKELMHPRVPEMPSCRHSTHLFAADALLGKLLVMAGAAVNLASFGDETLRADWPLAGDTGEAVVVPRVAFVLHALRTCQRPSGGKNAHQSETYRHHQWDGGLQSLAC